MLLLLLAASLPLCFGAEEHHYPNVTDAVHILFVDADHNGNGILTLREFIDSYLAYDHNNDDKISQTEFANYTQELAPELHGLEKALFTLYDSDHDHRLEMGDFVRFYEAIDTSGKDHVTEDQYKAYFITLYRQLSRVPDIIG